MRVLAKWAEEKRTEAAKKKQVIINGIKGDVKVITSADGRTTLLCEQVTSLQLLPSEFQKRLRSSRNIKIRPSEKVELRNSSCFTSLQDGKTNRIHWNKG